MNHTAAVITVSDSCSAGTRQDTSGPRVCAMVEQAGYRVIHTAVVPDDPDRIQSELVHCADTLRADLILTTGGTGLSPRDVTPESLIVNLPGSEKAAKENLEAVLHTLGHALEMLRGGGHDRT